MRTTADFGLKNLLIYDDSAKKDKRNTMDVLEPDHSDDDIPLRI